MRDPAAQVQNGLVSNLDMTPSAGLDAHRVAIFVGFGSFRVN